MPSELKPCNCGQRDFCVGQESMLPGRVCKIAAFDQRPSDAVMEAARKVAETMGKLDETPARDERTIRRLTKQLEIDCRSMAPLLPSESAGEPKGEVTIVEMSGLLDGDQCAAILAAQPCGTLITRLVVPNAPCGTCGGTKTVIAPCNNKMCQLMGMHGNYCDKKTKRCPDCSASSQEGK